VTLDPWERPAARVTRDSWERPPTNNDDKPWLDYQPAKPQPVATAQNGPRAFGQASNLDDPYANASLADSAAAIGRTADNAVRNAVDGATLGFGPHIAAFADAATGLAPDYSTALAAEQAQSARAMAQSPGGVGTAEQLLGTALPAGAVAKGAALIADAASAVPYLGRVAGSPFAQAQRSAGSMPPATGKILSRALFLAPEQVQPDPHSHGASGRLLGPPRPPQRSRRRRKTSRPLRKRLMAALSRQATSSPRKLCNGSQTQSKRRWPPTIYTHSNNVVYE